MANSLQKWIWRIVILALFGISLLYLLIQANGFQFDTYTNQFRHTGIIDIVYSNPRASVYLDGQKLNGKLPFVATNVLPGEYKLVIAEEGYWDYQTLVKVAPDLISRVQSVFLIPIYSASKLLWQENFTDGEQSFLENGYFFRQVGTTLSWAKLNGEQISFVSTFLPMSKLDYIEVFTKEALLIDNAGQRALLDLNSMNVQMIALDSRYRYIGERWLYFEDDVLVMFDRKISKIIWAKQPQLARKIVDLRYFNNLGREFIAIDYSGVEGALYELEMNNLAYIDQGRIRWVEVNQDGQLDYLKDDRSLWTVSNDLKYSKLVFRFAEQLQMLSSNWNVYGAEGVLFFKDEDGYWLSDRSFENSGLTFANKDVDQLVLQRNNILYYTVINDVDKQQTLYKWNPEQ